MNLHGPSALCLGQEKPASLNVQRAETRKRP
jgi:hypothetical protein